MKLKLRTSFIVGLALYASCYASFVSADNTLGHWLTRVRVIDVQPNVSSSTINLIGGEVTHLSNQVTPELDFSYFFNSHLATELILATTRHSVQATHTALGSVNLGQVSVLPPTLTLQYHFTPNQKINPYIGAGINYTVFYNALNGPVATSTHYGNNVGAAFQLGTDLYLNDHWLVNLDVKQLLLSSNVQVNTGLGQLQTKVTLNPTIIGLGVGYRT